MYIYEIVAKGGVFTEERIVEYQADGARLSTMKAGGTVRRVIRPRDERELCAVLRELSLDNEKPLLLGNGSNVVFRSCGYDGTVVLTEALSEVSVSGNEIYCGAGASLTGVAVTACENSLSGLEFAYGIPGTVGGGVFMNAGAYGGEMVDVIESVRCCDAEGNVKVLPKEALGLSYRHSAFMENGLYVLGATLRLARGDKDAIRAKMSKNMEKRRTKQPLEYPSCGSAFKRPEGYFAAALIEQCGLKGATVGGMQVSEKHSGFIINKGNATGDDVEALLALVQKTVYEKTGVMLETEVRLY